MDRSRSIGVQADHVRDRQRGVPDGFVDRHRCLLQELGGVLDLHVGVLPKLTKELRDRCVHSLRFPGDVTVSDADIDDLAKCDVEEEEDRPVLLMRDVHLALAEAGWSMVSSYRGKHTFTCGGRACYVWSDGKFIVTKTKHCPPDLLDGRLAALDERNHS